MTMHMDAPNPTLSDRVREALAVVADKFGILSGRFADRVAVMKAERLEARRQGEIARMAELLDRLNDRQLHVLGLSRGFLHSDIQDRYDTLVRHDLSIAPPPRRLLLTDQS